MIKSKNEKVQNFIDGIMVSTPEKYDSLVRMRNIVFETYPEVEEKFMYGGIIFSYKSEDFGGLFVSKNHISFEFSQGYKLKDPNAHLEGKGKFRRHLKIKSFEEIEGKEVAYYVQQAG